MPQLPAGRSRALHRGARADKSSATVRRSTLPGGLRVVTESHGLTHDGERYFGLLQVANGHDDSDFGLVVGVRNSHDKRFPAALVVGASVFVCVRRDG